MTDMTPDALFKLLSGMDDDAALPEALFAQIHTAQQACDILSKHFGIAITRLVKYDSEPPRYTLVFDGGREAHCGADDLLSQSRLRRVIFESVEQILPAFTRMKWESLRRFIALAVETENLGPDAKPASQLAQAIRHYLKGVLIEVRPSEGEYPFWSDDGLCIYSGHLKSWLALSYANPLSFQTLAGLLRDLDCEPETVHITTAEGKRSTRSVWRLTAALAAEAERPRPTGKAVA